MKTKNKVPSFFIKNLKDDANYYPSTKSRLWPQVKREFEKSGQIYCRVSYLKNLYNDGTFDKYPEVKKFIDSCTEKELIDYVLNGEW